MALPKMVEDNTMKMVAMTVKNGKDKNFCVQAFSEFAARFGSEIKDWRPRMLEMLKQCEVSEDVLAAFESVAKKGSCC